METSISEYTTKELRRTLKKKIVGLSVIALIATCVIFLVYEFWPHDITTIYFTKVSETFLTEDDAVKINGAKIGKVVHIENDMNGIKISAVLEKDIKIPKCGDVTEERVGILGERFLQIATHGTCSSFYKKDELIAISEPKNASKNVINDILTTPEKIDSILAILRRIESKTDINKK